MEFVPLIKKTHTEGEVWSHRGKSWTIKNGITQAVTKLDHIRNAVIMPYTCPNCGKPMQGHLDNKMWNFHKKCFDCVITEETQMKIDGTFEAYQKRLITGNLLSLLKIQVQDLQDYLNSTNVESFVTEAGDIENWEEGNVVADRKKLAQEYIDFLNKEIFELKNPTPIDGSK